MVRCGQTEDHARGGRHSVVTAGGEVARHWCHTAVSCSSPACRTESSGKYYKFQHCNITHFSLFGSYLWNDWSDLRENFITDVSSDKEVPAKFWNLSGSRYGLPVRTGFVLAEVCSLRVLFLNFISRCFNIQKSPQPELRLRHMLTLLGKFINYNVNIHVRQNDG